MTAQDAAFAVAIVLMLVALLAPVIGPRVGRGWAAWRRRVIARGIRRRLIERNRWLDRAGEPDAVWEDVVAPDSAKAWFDSFALVAQIARPVASAESRPPPGRQPLPQLERQPFGGLARWSPIPEHARSARWSDVHRYAPGAQRQTDPRAVMVDQEPPLSFVCVGCELAMPPLQTSRDCPYCGIHLLVRGPRVFWWRDHVEVGEWRP